MPTAVDYPMLPLLDMTLFPGSETSLFVGRALSRASVEAAIAGNKELVVVRQREFGTLEFTAGDLHTVGTLATVTSLTRLPDGTLKITVTAHGRVSIDSVRRSDHFRVFATVLPTPPCPPARRINVASQAPVRRRRRCVGRHFPARIRHDTPLRRPGNVPGRGASNPFPDTRTRS